jgi:asparagine synthase (glutamine-hydrolysing)
MCGIFLYFLKDGIFRKDLIKNILYSYSSIEHRGPDNHTLSFLDNCLVGFHRLAINDLSNKGEQPFELNGEFLVCNGEIYNYHELQKEHNFPLNSKSDCEIILHLFQKYGVNESLKYIDGVFAIIYIKKDEIHLIRDRIGVKPLFYSCENNFVVSSEPYALDNLCKNICELKPSKHLIYNKEKGTLDENEYYFLPKEPLYFDEDMSVNNIRNLLIDSVKKRLCSDRPIGCLLSGGLDSSIIASILCQELKDTNIKLKTFSVGFPDSTDIIYARKVANYLGTDHKEYIISYEKAIEYIPTVIKKIGTYDTTTIRASTPMYMLCEWINLNFKEKVIFSGEGSDEIFCGYLYSHNAPNDEELFKDSIRLVTDLYKYDVLRADRCTAGNSLEFREPFLDKNLLEYVLSMSGELKKPKKFEKDILRKAFVGYLPDEILWRRKAAFSDAVSSSEKPWYKWIQEYLDINIGNGTKERNYYKTIFSSFYKNYNPDIPLWLPKWNNVGEEPSATILNIYKKEEHI